MDDDIARYLADTYGMRGVDVAALVSKDPTLGARLVDGRPEILAQVDHAVARELARSLSDVMVRRTQLFFRDQEQGLGAAKVVAHRMAALLGWDTAHTAGELVAYQDEVALSRAWKEG